MTRTTNARIAGTTLLLYIVVGITQMVLSGRATGGATVAARLANMAQHATQVRIGALLGIVITAIALTLAASLYAITRDEDRDLARIAFVFRLTEAISGAMFVPMTIALLSLPAGSDALASFIFAAKRTQPMIDATFFAIGSTLFSILFLRGRMIPRALAWLGIAASILLAITLPLQLLGMLGRPYTDVMWIPMLVFEVPLALWFLIKGVAPVRQRS